MATKAQLILNKLDDYIAKQSIEIQELLDDVSLSEHERAIMCGMEAQLKGINDFIKQLKKKKKSLLVGNL